MKFSERIMKVEPSPTLAITALANSLKAKGIDVIGFGSGEPDFDTPKNIKEAAIRAIESGMTKYTPVGGIPQLKKAIVGKFKRENNLDYSPSEVIANCGGKHSFYNLMQVLLNKGDEVIIPAPYWVSYPPMVSLADGIPVILETTDETNFKITPEQLKKAITPRTRAILVNSPSNPTGAVYDKNELIALMNVIDNKEIIIITDDIYESILYDNRSFINPAMLSPDLKKRTIVLNGVSKAYSMTGWRIGYMAGDASIIEQVDILQSQSTSNPTSISQWASVEALDGDQEVIGEMVSAFARRRKIIVNGLNEVPGIKTLFPDGAFYAFPKVAGIAKLPGYSKIAEEYPNHDISSQVTSYLLKYATVAVVPGVAFGSPEYIRLSFATSDENIIEGVKRIKEAIGKLA